jgi:hypothetical protein
VLFQEKKKNKKKMENQTITDIEILKDVETACVVRQVEKRELMTGFEEAFSYQIFSREMRRNSKTETTQQTKEEIEREKDYDEESNVDDGETLLWNVFEESSVYSRIYFGKRRDLNFNYYSVPSNTMAFVIITVIVIKKPHLSQHPCPSPVLQIPITQVLPIQTLLLTLLLLLAFHYITPTTA